jgi:hypothetical protein
MLLETYKEAECMEVKQHTHRPLEGGFCHQRAKNIIKSLLTVYTIMLNIKNVD